MGVLHDGDIIKPNFTLFPYVTNDWLNTGGLPATCINLAKEDIRNDYSLQCRSWFRKPFFSLCSVLLYLSSRVEREGEGGEGEMATVKLSAPASQWVGGRKPLGRGPSVRPSFRRVLVPVVRAGSYTDELVQTAVSKLPNPNPRPSFLSPAPFRSRDLGSEWYVVIFPFCRDSISRFRWDRTNASLFRGLYDCF